MTWYIVQSKIYDGLFLSHTLIATLSTVNIQNDIKLAGFIPSRTGLGAHYRVPGAGNGRRFTHQLPSITGLLRSLREVCRLRSAFQTGNLVGFTFTAISRPIRHLAHASLDLTSCWVIMCWVIVPSIMLQARYTRWVGSASPTPHPPAMVELKRLVNHTTIHSQSVSKN